MKIAQPHCTTKERAREVIERKVSSLLAQFGGQASEVEHEWTGDVLYVSIKARGMSAKGTVEVTNTEVIIDGKLPLMALPFESRIRTMVQKEAEELFRTA